MTRMQWLSSFDRLHCDDRVSEISTTPTPVNTSISFRREISFLSLIGDVVNDEVQEAPALGRVMARRYLSAKKVLRSL